MDAVNQFGYRPVIRQSIILTTDLIRPFLTWCLSKWRRCDFFFVEFIKQYYIFLFAETTVMSLLKIRFACNAQFQMFFYDVSIFPYTSVFVPISKVAIRASCLSLEKLEITLLASLSSHVEWLAS